MVFESLVADLLNRFLGDFVDNLDSSQLNIGIWGGDVKLENLEVKETALDDLDLPVKLKFGYLSSLVLKIPWKNLYTEPVIANIDGLHLIVVPNKGVVYNEEKAKKNEQDVKQKTLTRLEEARKNRRKPPDPTQDSFTEKLVAQVIKNLQIKIKNIHVRFEDKYTNRHRPFVAGLTLESLDFETTDANWKATIHKDVVKIVHKLVSLNNLAVYWNTSSDLFSDYTDKKRIKEQMLSTIAVGAQFPKDYKYILEPIKMQAKLSLNQKPETDGMNWTVPKIELSVNMETIGLSIGKNQYQDILLFLEAQERFTTAGQYLKYRPNLLEYRGHYKEWWHFAYKAILEEKVRRRRRNWSWERIKAHRKLVKEYKEAWIKHQTQASPPQADKDLIKKAEETLDVFNINITRQQAELEIDRRKLTRVEDQPQGWGAWAKSWWGGGSGQPADGGKGGKGDIASQFQEAMTPEEKAKLFEAIDYQENTPPTDYPKEYVENKFMLDLRKVALKVEGAILLEFLLLKAHIEQRPSARAINIKSSISELRMDGCNEEMLRLREKGGSAWLDLLVDTNPLHGDYDQLVKLAIAPVSIKYHAPAVNNALDVFKPPESVKLNQLTAAAMSRYEEVKERSVTGLAHAVEGRTKLVLDIRIQPATIFISEGGSYKPDAPTIIADLGLLTISTIDTPAAEPSADKLKSLMDQAYDKFSVKLTNIILLLAPNVAEGEVAKKDSKSPFHLIRPTGLDISIYKSSIDDLRLSKMKIFGALPDIVLNISDQRLLMLMKLLFSIPTPKPDEEVAIETDNADAKFDMKLKDRAKMRAIMEVSEVDEEALATAEGGEAEKPKKNYEQQVMIELDLKLNEVGVIVSRGEHVLVGLAIERLGCKLQMRSFDLLVEASLGSIRVVAPQFRSLDPSRKSLHIIDNVPDDKDGQLVKVKFIQANPESPFFATEYNKTEQFVDFTFAQLNVTLHQEALVTLKAFGEELQGKIAELQKVNPENAENVQDAIEGQTRKLSRKLSASMQSLGALAAESQKERAERLKARKERKLEEEKDHTIVKTKVVARFGSLGLMMGTEKALETALKIDKVTAELLMKDETTRLIAGLQSITMRDETAGAVHRDLLSVCGDKEMFHLDFTQFVRSEQQKKHMKPSDIDMLVKVRFAQMRFVFLNLWLSRLMCWLAPFQAEAVRAAAAAQAAAAEKAAEAAQNVKQIMEASPPRIQLDVELAAPTLVLPRLSTSTEVLVFDLGNLVVRNTIGGDRRQPKAIIDSMNIQLKDVNFATGRLDDNTLDVAAKCEVLKPISFSVSIHRNLTFGLYKELPEIAIDAHLPLIDVSMSQEDYATLMQTLNGNLNEGKEEATAAAEPVVSEDSHVKPISSDVSTSPVTSPTQVTTSDRKKSTVTQSRETTPALAESKTRIVFQFQIDTIKAVLYGPSDQLGKSGIIVRDPKAAFASLQLKGIKLSGEMREDSSLTTAILLQSLTMDDERRDKTKIHRLLDKKDSGDSAAFISLNFAQNAKQDKNVKLRMSAFFICLCPEFLGCMSAFFAVKKTEEELELERIQAEKARAVTAATTTSTTSVASDNTTPAPDTQPSGSLTLDLNIHGLETILVEDALAPETTQALILSFNVKLLSSVQGEESKLNGGVENLRIFSSYYAPEKRGKVSYEVLKKLNIKIDGVINNVSQAKKFAIDMDDIEMRMSPSIIRLLSAVNSEFAKSSGTGTGNDTEGTASSSWTPKLRLFPDYWKARKLNERLHSWLTSTEEAEEASEETGVDTSPIVPESATVTMRSFNVTLEAGTEEVPIPLIYLDLRFSAHAEQWSSSLFAEASLGLQLSYYNETYSVWEPVIEPTEKEDGTWESWSLDVTAQGRPKDDESKPAMEVKINAPRVLNFTVTKSFLLLLNNLSKVFEKAAKQMSPPLSRQLPGTGPFLVLNESGMLVRVNNTKTLTVSPNGESVDATHGAFVEADLVGRKDLLSSPLDSQRELIKADLHLELLDTIRETNVSSAEMRLLGLPNHSDAGKQWKLLVDTTIENKRRIVTLRSNIQVINHLGVDIEVYSKKDTTLDMCGIATANEGVLYVAVPLVYTPTGEFYFKTTNDKCEVSNESVSWHSFETTKTAIVRCDVSESEPFYMETVAENVKVFSEKGKDKTADTWTVHLYPPCSFQNVLPFPVQILHPIEKKLEAGEISVISVVPGSRFRLSVDYLAEKYFLDMKIPDVKKELEVVALNTENGSAELLLGLHWLRDVTGLKCMIYAPYWLVNNTGKRLRYLESSSGFLTSSTKACVPCKKSRADEQDTDVATVHEPGENPVILPYASSDFASKKKAKLQIGDSSWSDPFPIDTAGNAGRISCKTDSKNLDVTVDIQVCQSGLSKVVTFSPFYLISNLSKHDMEVAEDNSDEWILIPAEKCVGIWPTPPNKSKKVPLRARYFGYTEATVPFPFTESFEALARLPNDYVGIHVAVTVGDSSVAIHLNSFQPGLATVQIFNHTRRSLKYGQHGFNKLELGPGQTVFYSWESIMEDRVLDYEMGDHKDSSGLDHTRHADLFADAKNRRCVYSALFLNGKQRTLLFDEDKDLTLKASGNYEGEPQDMHAVIELQGIGISVVDNLNGYEVLYMGISSSDILWEEETRKGRFKPFAVKHMVALENGYQKHLEAGSPEGYVTVDKYEVDFKNKIMKRSKGKETKLRRTFEKGIVLDYQQTKQLKTTKLQITHLQIDNQLPACVFPCVLAMVPPPKSIAADSVPKPFVNVLIAQRMSEHSSVPEIYLDVLVQEFAVQVDQGLINSLLTIFAGDAKPLPYSQESFAADYKLTQVRLEDTANIWKSLKPKSYYDYFKVSPLMIHLSFSQGGGSSSGRGDVSVPIQSEFFNVLIKSVGVTLTEIQDVVFRLAYFERKSVFYSQDQLNGEIASHYTKQFIKQLYVLVFGLDVIGNPFGLVRDLTAGVEDLFYQPFQGIIQGPEEFAAGMALGVQSLLGHTVGGLTGAVGRITGTVGKGVAALTLDDEYQRKRQEDLNRKPASFGEGMARGMKGLGMGVYEGVTGVVTKPIEGARSGGAGGFVKGVGKGLVGVVTRPVSGVVDFASSSLSAVRTVAGTHHETGPLRPPRLIKEDHIVTPYSPTNALGAKILNDTDHGRYATDDYVIHAPITDKCALVVTNNRLLLTKRGDVVGTWSTDWALEYTQMRSSPEFVDGGVKVLFKEKKKGFLGIGGSEGKIITFANAEVIQKKIQDAYQHATS